MIQEITDNEGNDNDDEDNEIAWECRVMMYFHTKLSCSFARVTSTRGCL
jgi:hypothetical protein